MMKKFGIGILLGSFFMMTGCLDDEGYSLTDMWIGFGILQETENESYQIVLDNDDVLIPVTGFYYNDYHDSQVERHLQYENGDRILVNYTILGDDVNDSGEIEAYLVKVNSMKKILMKGILDVTTENQDSIGNDPIIVEDYWLTDSLLNFEIKYWGRYKTHFINLVKQPGELSVSAQPLQLELRHNARNDDEDIPFSAYVSFKLRELEISELDSIQFVVKATDYDDEVKTFEGTYHYGQYN